MPQNRESDIITDVTLNTINDINLKTWRTFVGILENQS